VGERGYDAAWKEVKQGLWMTHLGKKPGCLGPREEGRMRTSGHVSRFGIGFRDGVGLKQRNQSRKISKFLTKLFRKDILHLGG
jgi:hypothetical protein